MAHSVLLTGGAGFIGSHTAVELLQAGYDVVIADDLSNCTEDVVTRIGRITGRAPAFHQVDVADRAALEEVFEQHDFETVIHFAGFKAVGESVKEPLKYYRNNLDTTLTLLETMAYHHVNTIVFSSSATVYGVPETVPLTEDMPTGCTNPYGWTKYMIEQILRDQAAAHPELSVVLLRYFNPIGAHPSGLIGELPQGIPNNLLPSPARRCSTWARATDTACWTSSTPSRPPTVSPSPTSSTPAAPATSPSATPPPKRRRSCWAGAPKRSWRRCAAMRGAGRRPFVKTFPHSCAFFHVLIRKMQAVFAPFPEKLPVFFPYNAAFTGHATIAIPKHGHSPEPYERSKNYVYQEH